MSALSGYKNISNSLSTIELESASRLMDTNFALETAKLMKNTLIQKYASAMVSKAQESENNKKLLIL